MAGSSGKPSGAVQKHRLGYHELDGIVPKIVSLVIKPC